MQQNKKKKKVLLIGWDAADWKFLTPLMDQGLMPNLTKLVEGGVSGKLTTLDPPLSPTLWTSIATGVRPYKHGIHGFSEPTPDEKSVRPIFSNNRKVKAIWNILSEQGMKTHVVGWWPSHPAEAINGIMVSDFFHRSHKDINTQWPLAKGCIYPDHLNETFAKLRIHPQELTQAHILPFVPNAAKVNQKRDKRLYGLAKTTADCSTIQSVATYIMDHYDWDFMGVYFDAIDHYGHGFMKYHPPHRPHIPLTDFELFKDVVKVGCRYHDMMLGRLLQLAGEDTMVLLISDHGFHPDHNRPTELPNVPAGPAMEHSPYGIIVCNGPGIKKDELLFGASLLDITPTILTYFGLPVAQDMDGKVLSQIFKNPPEVNLIKSWENFAPAPNAVAQLSPTTVKEVSQEDMDAELQQLINLGYIEDPGPDKAAAVKKTKNENNYYLSRAYIDGGKWEEGIQLLEQLHEENPKIVRYASQLTYAYQATGQYKKARAIVNHLRELFDRENPQLDILEGTLLMAENKNKRALELFQKAEAEAGDISQIYLRIGKAYLQLNRFEESIDALHKELNKDPESFHAWQILGIAHFNTMQYEEAEKAFRTATGLNYFAPLVHFHLGETLLALERYEEAVQAYEIALELNPAFNIARQQIINIYTSFLNQAGKANKYRLDFLENLQGEVMIVSGLPRSGTSMMMQMLEAGGIKIFTDKERSADENNPKGYYEHEVVKSLARNKKWLPAANKKAVKVIAQLLQHLPNNFYYRIVFMERELQEVLQSQQKMLSRNGAEEQDHTLSPDLLKSYESTLKIANEWVRNQPNMEILFVKHREVIENPFFQAMRVNDFLGGKLLVEKMAQVVDHKLYREKIIE